MAESEKELHDFWNKLLQKIYEAQHDFNQLSPENQEKARTLGQTVLMAGSFEQAVTIIMNACC